MWKLISDDQKQRTWAMIVPNGMLVRVWTGASPAMVFVPGDEADLQAWVNELDLGE